MVEIQGPCCPTCGRPFPSPELGEIHPEFRCGRCRLRAADLDGARALLAFHGPVREAIHLFKYGDRWTTGPGLLRRAAPTLSTILWEADLILPVPLDSFRLRMRGFNQAAVLAREISKSRGIPVEYSLLLRAGRRRPQVGLQGEQRLQNVRGCFSVKRHEKIEMKRILLVDDVLTTGATANECAKVLKKAGARSVRLIALAAALYMPQSS